eukprot:gene9859-11520_t
MNNKPTVKNFPKRKYGFKQPESQHSTVAEAEAQRKEEAQLNIIVQFKNKDDETQSTGPPINISQNVTIDQLEQLINNLLNNDEQLPYSFYVGDNEIVSNLKNHLEGQSEDLTLNIYYQPQAVFRVTPVSRCSSSLEGHTEAVLNSAFSPDGTNLASVGGDTTLRIWDLETQLPRFTCRGHTNWVLQVAWSPDGTKIATGGMEGDIRIWNPLTGKQMGSVLKGHTKFITASSSKDATVKLWDTESCRPLMSLSGHTMSVTCVKWSGEGFIYTASQDRTIRVYNTTEGKTIRVLEGHAHWVNTLALNTDYVLRTGPFDHTGKRFDTVEESQARALERYNEIKNDQKGEILVSGSDDFTVIIWNPSTTKTPVSRLTGHQQLINLVSFSPNGRLFASASFDKSIKLWDAMTGKFLGNFRGHVGAVYQIWDIKTKKMTIELPGHADEATQEDDDDSSNNAGFSSDVLSAAARFKDGVATTRSIKRNRRKFAITMTPSSDDIVSPPTTPSGSVNLGTPKSASSYPSSPSVSPNQSLSPSYKKGSNLLYSPNSRNDEAPHNLGKYQILHHIGHGYFGNTFSAVPLDSSEYVAIKLLDTGRVPVNHQALIKKEFEILKTLTSQNIVNYISLINEHNNFGVVQEFVENGSLSDIYKRLGSFPESLIVKYIIQILECLHYIHSQEIIHKNIKANNVLLAKGGKCKLSDFGLGCTLGSSFRNTIHGEPYWLAPELLLMRDFNQKVDALMSIVDEKRVIELPKDISKELAAFLTLCFTKDPKQRPSVDVLMKHQWLGVPVGADSSMAFSALLNQPPLKFTAPSSTDHSSKPRSENFSIDFLSQMEANEHDITQLSPISSSLVDLNSYDFRSHQSVDRSLPLETQIEQLRAMIDHNANLTAHMKEVVDTLQKEQTISYNLQVQMKAKMQEILDQNKTGARISAHSNQLLKRTNQMASDLTRKNEYFRHNIKRLEDYLLTKDDCAKKLANVVYKHKISFDNLLNPTLATPVVFQVGSKLWKKGQEKRALGTLKDNFLFFFKNDKSTGPLDVVYLNDKKNLSVSSSQDSTKKKTFFISIGTTISSGEHDGGEGAGSQGAGSPPANASTKDLAAMAPTVLWCLLAFDNQKDMEGWYGVLEAAISWYERKPNEISKPLLEMQARAKHTKQKSVDNTTMSAGSGSWRKESGGLKFPGVFGIKLEDVMSRENPNLEIPAFVSKMVHFLERNIQEEGILRISGSTTEIQDMKATLQKGENIDYLSSNRDTHAVAGLLKLYLRELPDSLVPLSLRVVSAEIIADRTRSDADKIACVIDLFKQLPKHDHNLLMHMIRFAKRVTEQSEHNKMVLSNVTTCFAQSLKGLIPGLFTFCVLNYEQVFVVPRNQAMLQAQQQPS